MPPARNLRETGSRIEALLEEVRSVPDAATREKVEELVRLLVELYGAGLERVVGIVAADETSGPRLLNQLTADDLVASLLVLHGLHPLDLETRVHQALEKVRPYLGSHAGGVELLGVDDGGVVRLRLEGSCHGCPSSTVTVKLAIERAIAEAAPEVTRVDVDGVTASPVISLDSLRRDKPGGNGHATNGDGAGGWTAITDMVELRPGELLATAVAGAAVIVCSTAGNLYAYRNACPACDATWEGTGLEGQILSCPACDQRYDVHLAGKGVERPELHLAPLPLLREDGQVRIAVPGGRA
ncbi:MAG: NifU family protein [Chloroflexia bacterium]|nr:NifU family protein [Chloroflexia bacterium]